MVNSCSIAFDMLYNIEFEASVKDVNFYLHHFLWFTENKMLISIITENHNLLCILSLDEVYAKNHLKIQYVVIRFFKVR